MKNFVMFPYHPDIETIVRFRDMLVDFEFMGCISFAEDLEIIKTINITIGQKTIDDISLIKQCDILIVVDNYRGCRTDKYYEIIKTALSLKKEVIVTPLAESQLDLCEFAGQYEIMENLPMNCENLGDVFKYNVRQSLYETNIPVIGIVGQGKNSGKFECELLVQSFLNKEYQTNVITCNALGALFGFYTIPAFMYSNIAFQEKVLKFNHFIRIVSKQKKADLIILEIPEGIMPFERQEFHHFAEYPHIISYSVKIDIAVLCTYFVNGPKIKCGISMLLDYCQERFGIPIGAVAVSKILFDIPQENFEKITFEYLEYDYLQKYYPDISKIGLPMINILDRSEASRAIIEMFTELCDGISVI